MREKDKNQVTPTHGNTEKTVAGQPKRKGSAFNEKPVGHKDRGEKAPVRDKNEEDRLPLKDSNL